MLSESLILQLNRRLYQPSTGNNNLYRHVEAFHAAEYILACKKYNWKIKINVAESITGLTEPARVPFTHARFRQALVDWIIADDQVCTSTVSRQ